MKRVLAGLLGILLLLGLAGCWGYEGSEPPLNFVEHATDPSAISDPVQSSAGGVSSSQPQTQREVVSIMGLKGPTTMGMVRLWNLSEAQQTRYDYAIQMKGTADEIVPKLVSGEVPIAAIPANLASVLYATSGGRVKVAAINTLGVLYLLETGDAIQSVEDLRGKTIYSTGKGTTPEYAMNYILEQNGLEPGVDVTIEYKSEATEIAALLKTADDAIAVLPQPYVTAVLRQNDKLRIALDLNEEWGKVGQGSAMITGVLAVNSDWLAENEQLFANVLSDYHGSIYWVSTNLNTAAELIANYGIVEQADVAREALPYCNITFLAGNEMRDWLGGYLQVLYSQNPDAVGGSLPGDDFYYDAIPANFEQTDEGGEGEASDVSDVSSAA